MTGCLCNAREAGTDQLSRCTWLKLARDFITWFAVRDAIVTNGLRAARKPIRFDSDGLWYLLRHRLAEMLMTPVGTRVAGYT